MSYSILLLFSNSAIALDDFNHLENVDFSILAGNRVQIKLNFANRVQNHKSFSTNNPARIVLDFPKTKVGFKQKYHPIGIGLVEGTRVVSTNDRSRVVINLVRMVAFDINVVNNKVLVLIENTTSQTTAAGDSMVMPISSMRGPHIQNIDFRRTQEGSGHITITLSDPSIQANMRQEGGDIVVVFNNTVLPKKLDRRLDVLDFGTPISFIDTFPSGPNVRINITSKGNYEHHAYQSENFYVIEVNEKIIMEDEQVAISEREYTGQLVSFNFQKIEVRAVLKLLFELPGVNRNMIIGEEIKGTVTLRLNHVPWDQALDIILEARGLGMREIGNVVLIDLQDNINKRRETNLSTKKRIKNLEPLQTEFINFNYANAKTFVDGIKTLGNKEGRTFLSERGVMLVDERTNSLMIKDTAEEITQIRKLITALDTPIRQVLIEARVVIATSTFTKDLGVKFGSSFNQDLGSNYGVVFGGKLPGDTDFSGPTGITGGNSDGFLVSLPAGGPTFAAGLAIGKIGSYLLQLELTAMQSEGKGEVISSPRLITGNQQSASIMQGTQIAYVAPGGVGTTGTVEWKSAVLKLDVTPQITPDNRISLELTVTKDAPGATINGQTSIDNREINTNVLVDNGETVVLGGVYERTISRSVDRTPFLSYLPIIGELFKHRSNKDDKSELLIFVTPKILKDK